MFTDVIFRLKQNSLHAYRSDQATDVATDQAEMTAIATSSHVWEAATFIRMHGQLLLAKSWCVEEKEEIPTKFMLYQYTSAGVHLSQSV